MFAFRITPVKGEPYDLTVTSRDILVWERNDVTNRMSRLENDPTFADLYSVTHIAAQRQGMFDGVLAAWETTVDLMPIPNTEPMDPTRPGP
jgi:hypothetical protein